MDSGLQPEAQSRNGVMILSGRDLKEVVWVVSWWLVLRGSQSVESYVEKNVE